MTKPRFSLPASVKVVRKRLDKSIRDYQSAARGFTQQANFEAAGAARDRAWTLQLLRSKLFGIPLGPYTANRHLFPRPRRRKASR